ncbi:MAG: hypothetical protein EZS28_027705 [Streblomastix strix]|uniref:Uncharacterized protein n=1 Tax=Streblomastix strix TaxID=222440 RepID=A0A5J4V2C8_9EUKA|nr:MAG: hypothetical protein EZS28_027705 [Streblomastix strix]
MTEKGKRLIFTEESDEATSDSQETHNEDQDPRNDQHENHYDIPDFENDNQSKTEHDENNQDEQILAVSGQLQLNQNWRMLEFPIQGLIDFDGEDPDLLQIALEPYGNFLFIPENETEKEYEQCLAALTVIWNILVQKEIFQIMLFSFSEE